MLYKKMNNFWKVSKQKLNNLNVKKIKLFMKKLKKIN